MRDFGLCKGQGTGPRYGATGLNQTRSFDIKSECQALAENADSEGENREQKFESCS